MPDTQAEKQTGLHDCNKCKYVATCDLFKSWKNTPVCLLGGETIGYISPRIISFSSNSAAGSTPNDSTVYYAGASQYGFLTTTGAGGFIMPSNGILRRAHMYLYSGTTTGTNEAWDVVIRNDTKTTDYTFASVSAATILRRWINNDLNIPVSQGDEIFFKTTTPAWATNPDGVRYNGFVWIEI